MRRTLLAVGVLVVVLAIGVGWHLAPIAPIATGNAAADEASGNQGQQVVVVPPRTWSWSGSG